MKLICERCSNAVHFFEKCGYCGKMVCRNCVKAGKRMHKVKRLIICKGCWGDLKKRRQYKAALN